MKNEWQVYGRTWKEFVKDRLCVPGTLIELDRREHRRLLVGDINSAGGDTDECLWNGPGDAEIVNRHKLVWAAEDEE
jgi:hypothetical protein